MLTSGPCEKEDIVEERDGRRERAHITAASAAYLNIAVEPTANSLRAYVAPAIGGGSPRALGAAPIRKKRPLVGVLGVVLTSI